MLGHEPGPGHPERPERLAALLDDFAARPVPGVTPGARARPRASELERCTPSGSRRAGGAVRPARRGWIPTPWCRRELGGGAAGRRGGGGRRSRRWSPVRQPTPSSGLARPGTTPSRAGPWVSACSTTSPSPPSGPPAGPERILIIDWDVHHGNGTQHSFESPAGRAVHVLAPVSRSTRAPARPTEVGEGRGARVHRELRAAAGAAGRRHGRGRGTTCSCPSPPPTGPSWCWCRPASIPTPAIRWPRWS